MAKYPSRRLSGIRHTLPFVTRFAGLWFLVTVAAVIVAGGSSFLMLHNTLPAEAWSKVLVMLLVQTGLIILFVGGLAVVSTHRIAGPAHVLERAIDALAAGDYEHRLKLRKRDYLKPVAAAFERLRSELHRRSGERERALRELGRCIDEQDLAGAREILVRFGVGTTAPKVETPQ